MFLSEKVTFGLRFRFGSCVGLSIRLERQGSERTIGSLDFRVIVGINDWDLNKTYKKQINTSNDKKIC